jgi:hypothetical protein
MRKLEEFDEKFVMEKESLKQISGGLTGTSEWGTESTCQNNCSDSRTVCRDDDGNIYIRFKTVVVSDRDC